MGLHHCQLNMVSKMAAKTINWTFAHVLVFQHCYKESFNVTNVSV